MRVSVSASARVCVCVFVSIALFDRLKDEENAERKKNVRLLLDDRDRRDDLTLSTQIALQGFTTGGLDVCIFELSAHIRLASFAFTLPRHS